MFRYLLFLSLLYTAILADDALADTKLKYKVFDVSSNSSMVWVELTQFDDFDNFDHTFVSPNTFDYDIIVVILDQWADSALLEAEPGYPISKVVDFLTKGNNTDKVIASDIQYRDKTFQKFYILGNASGSTFCLSKYLVDKESSKIEYTTTGGSIINLEVYNTCKPNIE